MRSLPFLAVGAVAYALAGCVSPSGLNPPSTVDTSAVYSSADASVLRICGSLINQPASGSEVAWFRDATTSDTTPIDVLASPSFDYGAAPWVIVSRDCVRGVDIALAPTGHVAIADAVYSSTHRYVAIRLRGIEVGTITLTGSVSGKATMHGQIEVTVRSG